MRNPNCTLCPLHETAKTVCIEGDGPMDAPIWFVGEAPGREEDEKGIPFVGASGRMLRDLMAEAGFKEGEFRITNAVRCRPPANRTPTPEETRICTAAYLLPELVAERPAVVVAVGGTALKAVTGGNAAITKARGNPIRLPLKTKVKHIREFKNGKVRETLKEEIVAETTLLPILHPAYGLRNPAAVPLIASDLHIAKRLHDKVGQEEEETDYKACVTVDEVYAAYLELKDEPKLSFDIETYAQPNAFDPRNKDFKVLSCSISARKGHARVFGIEHPDLPFSHDERYVKFVTAILKELLENKTRKTTVAHNGKYDSLCLWVNTGIRPHLTYDTMVMAHLLNENEPVGLKNQARRWLGAGHYEDDIVWQKKGVMQIPAWDILWPYNARDTDYTLRLYEHQRERVRHQPSLVRLFHKLLMPALRVLIKLEYNGMYMDKERIVQRLAENKKLRAEQEAIVLSCVPEERRHYFNVDAPADLLWLLYTHRGMSVQRHPKTKAATTSKEALAKLEDLYLEEVVHLDGTPSNKELLAAIREYRKRAKYERTYLTKWLDKMDEKGFVYPKYNMAGGEKQGTKGKDEDAGVVTGRLSSDYHTTPRDKFLRGCTAAPPGKVILHADLSQIELRIMAHASGDPNLIEAYRTGKDVHAMMARRALELIGTDPDSVSKDEFKNYRTLAKGINFGYLYGMEWPKFMTYMRTAFGMTITAEQAQTFRRAFFEMWPRISVYHKQQRYAVENYKKVESLLGRLRRLPDIDSDDGAVRSGCVRQAINSPIQATGSDINLLAMVMIDEEIEKLYGDAMPYEEYPIHCFLTFHDALDYYVADDPAIINYWKGRVKYHMEHPPLKELFGVTLAVPLVADVEVSKWWGE